MKRLSQQEAQRRQRELTREYDRVRKDLASCATDPAIMRLAHPLRALASASTQPKFILAGTVGVAFEDATIQRLREGLTTNSLWLELEAAGAHQFLQFIQLNASGSDGGFSGGSSGAMFQAMRYMHAGGAMFTIDDALLPLLMLTDIDLDVPITDVRLPYPNIYIEFGRDRSRMPAELALHNSMSGEHAFEGAYVSRTVDKEGGAHLEVTMTGSPSGHKELGDDAVEWLSLHQSEGLTIHDALYGAFEKATPMIGSSQAQLDDFKRLALEHREIVAPKMSKRLELILKALLYIDLKEARRQTVTERSDAQKAWARTQSGAHRRKALRQLMRAQDTILVLPPEVTEGRQEGAFDADADPHSMMPHWRRGHFRRQRHGAALAFTKVVWISPKLVNAALLGTLAPAPSPKHYVVKA